MQDGLTIVSSRPLQTAFAQPTYIRGLQFCTENKQFLTFNDSLLEYTEIYPCSEVNVTYKLSLVSLHIN